MFEFHGWLHVSETSCETEDDEVNRAGIVERAKALCESESDGSSLAEVRLFNGEHFLSLHGFRNHTQSWVFELFESVANSGKGCFGTLHIRDDEDPKYNNEVQYFVARRGQVTRVEEPHLSPCMPVLES